MYNLGSRLEETHNQGVIILFQINPQLHPKLPREEEATKFDSNYGVSEEWTKQILYIEQF